MVKNEEGKVTLVSPQGLWEDMAGRLWTTAKHFVLTIPVAFTFNDIGAALACTHMTALACAHMFACTHMFACLQLSMCSVPTRPCFAVSKSFQLPQHL